MRRARTVNNPLRNDEALARSQRNRTIFKINEKLSIKTKEKLVVIVVLMPVIFTLHHTQPYNRVIHLAERLVVPLVGDSSNERVHVNFFQLRDEYV